ncbi:MAG: bifunctional DNA primase/polymerase [Zavarzinella sp.]
MNILSSNHRKSSLLDAAIQYANMGYKVFPLVTGKKAPATTNGFKDATCNLDQIRAWWTKFPNANIGIATEDLVVIDLDGTDNVWLNQPWPKQTPIASTPRGGKHYYFHAAGNKWKSSAGQLDENVDVRSMGGYIVAPPSVVDGKKYTWDRPLCTVTELREAPQWLRGCLTYHHDKGENNLPAPDRNRPGDDFSARGSWEDTGLIDAGWKWHHQLDPDRGFLTRPGKDSGISATVGMLRNKYGLPLFFSFTPKGGLPANEAMSKFAVYAHLQHEGDFEKAAKDLAARGYGKAGRTAVRKPVMTSFADIESREIEYLWPERIPIGKLTLIAGRPKAGKSFLTCDIAARVSTGSTWPDGTPCQQGEVIFMTAEDDPEDTIRPRLENAGADLKKIHLLRGITCSDGTEEKELMIRLTDVEQIDQAIKDVPGCRLIIVDPIGSFLGGDVDAHRDNEVRSILAPIAKIARDNNVAIVLVCHVRKSAGNYADGQILGSVAFAGIARSIYHLDRSSEDHSLCRLLPGGTNVGRQMTGLGFRINGDPARIEWESEPIDLTADDALEAEAANMRPGPKPEALDTAKNWLKSQLEGESPVRSKTLFDAWINGEGGSKPTLQRAKEALGIVSRKNGNSWYWELPVDEE